MFIYIAYGEVVDYQLHQTKTGQSFHKILIKDHYDKRLEFTLWPDESGKRVVGDVVVGANVCVHGTINSREYNQKYYTDPIATRLEVLSAPKVVARPMTQPNIPDFDMDDVPF